MTVRQRAHDVEGRGDERDGDAAFEQGSQPLHDRNIQKSLLRDLVFAVEYSGWRVCGLWGAFQGRAKGIHAIFGSRVARGRIMAHWLRVMLG